MACWYVCFAMRLWARNNTNNCIVSMLLDAKFYCDLPSAHPLSVVVMLVMRTRRAEAAARFVLSSLSGASVSVQPHKTRLCRESVSSSVFGFQRCCWYSEARVTNILSMYIHVYLNWKNRMKFYWI